MQLKLKVTKGKHVGQEVPVPGPKFLIGRSEDCHLRPGSDAISRHHCVIVLEQGYAGVRDFGSKNGTYVNDERVVGERPLKNGDQLRIGPLEFEAEFFQSVGGKKRPHVKDVNEVAARITAGEAADSDKDIDISDWIDDEQEAAGETHTSVGGTVPAGSETDVAYANQLNGPADDDTIEIQSPIPKPNLTYQSPDVAPKDTRDAAMDTLKKMQQMKKDQQK